MRATRNDNIVCNPFEGLQTFVRILRTLVIALPCRAIFSCHVVHKRSTGLAQAGVHEDVIRSCTARSKDVKPSYGIVFTCLVVHLCDTKCDAFTVL